MKIAVSIALFLTVWLSGGRLELHAQKPSKEVQKDYNDEAKKYSSYLSASFAYRYIYNEQYLYDIIQVVVKDLKNRKSKGTLSKDIEQEWRTALTSTEKKDELKKQLNDISAKIVEARSVKAKTGELKDADALVELHTEYERIYGEEFELTRLGIVSLRNQILKVSQQGDNEALLAMQLDIAFKRYLQGVYRTAALEFEDILEGYKPYFTQWDDVYFYLGECYYYMGDYESAGTQFAKITKDYPESKFVERALTKLIRMAYVETSRNKMDRYYGEYQTKIGKKVGQENKYYELAYLAGVTNIRTSDYSRAIAILNEIPASSAYYIPALYGIANCQANQDAYDNAVETLEQVIKPKTNVKIYDLEIQRKITDLAKLKIAYIRYEQAVNGLKARAVMPAVSQLSSESEYFDAALLVAAWSYFKDNSIDTAKIYVDSLVRNFPSSDFVFEAKTLLGNVHVLDPLLSDKDRELFSVEAYNYVANSMEAKYLADQFVSERDSIYRVLDQLDEAKQSASFRRDSVLYNRYNIMSRMLTMALRDNGFNKASKASGRSSFYFEVVSGLVGKLKVTEQRLKNAESKNDQKAVKALTQELNKTATDLETVVGYNSKTALDSGSVDQSIKSLADQLGGELNDVVLDDYSTFQTQSYFSQNNLPRLLSEIDSRNRAYAILREKLAREKQQVQDQLAEIDRMMEEAQAKNNKNAVIKLKTERNKLADFYYQLADYEVWMAAQDNIENYADLDLWGDFAAYGRNNITYVINTTKTESIDDMGRAISQIDKILAERKKNYEHQIAVLEQEIKLKELEIREKELREMRSSQKQFFEQQYFLIKDTEKPEDDPYDYKDIVPEVVTISDSARIGNKQPTDDKTEETVSDSAAAAVTDSTSHAPIDSLTNGTEEFNSDAADSTNGEKPDGEKSDEDTGEGVENGGESTMYFHPDGLNDVSRLSAKEALVDRRKYSLAIAV